jgi:hypothetical protein
MTPTFAVGFLTQGLTTLTQPLNFSPERINPMQRLLIVLVYFACLLAGLASTTRAQDNPFGRARTNYCSLGTIKGTYSFTANGQLFPEFPNTFRPGVPFTSIGVVTNDGAGNISYQASPNVNAAGNDGAFSARVNGTYTVRQDCSGTATFPQTNEVYNFVILDEGRELWIISAVPGTLITATARRQDDPAPPRVTAPPSHFPQASACTMGMIKGTYAFLGTEVRIFPNFPLLTPEQVAAIPPQGLPFMAVGVQYFDGAGRTSHTFETDSAGGIIFPPMAGLPSGNYTVNADCTGSYKTPGGFDTNIVVAEGGREFRIAVTTRGFTGTVVWRKISDARLAP